MAGRRGGGEGFIHPRAPRVRTNPYFRRIHKRGVRNPVSNIGTNEPPISATRTERVPWTGTRCPPNRTSLRPSLPPRPSLPSHHPVRRLTESETRLGPTENAARKLGTNRERGVTETARARASKEEKGGRKTETGRERERERDISKLRWRPRAFGGSERQAWHLRHPLPPCPIGSNLFYVAFTSICKRTNASPCFNTDGG